MNAIRIAPLVLLLALSAPPTHAAPTHATVLPFIADDYARALAEARARHVPLFVESWAPW